MSFSLRNLFRKEEIGGFEARSLSDQRVQQHSSFAATDPSQYFQPGNGVPSLGAPANPDNPFSSPFLQGAQANPPRRTDLPPPSSNPVPFPVAFASQAPWQSSVAPPPLSPQGFGGSAPAQDPAGPFMSPAPFGAVTPESSFSGAQQPFAPQAASPFGTAEQGMAAATTTAVAHAPIRPPASPFSSVEAPPEATPFQAEPTPMMTYRASAPASGPAPGEGGAWQFAQPTQGRPTQETPPGGAPARASGATEPSSTTVGSGAVGNVGSVGVGAAPFQLFAGTPAESAPSVGAQGVSPAAERGGAPFSGGSPFGDASGAVPAIRCGDPVTGRGVPGPIDSQGMAAAPPAQTDGAFTSRIPEVPRGATGSFTGAPFQSQASPDARPHAYSAPVEPEAAPPVEAKSTPATTTQSAASQEVPENGGGSINLNLSVILAGVPAQILGFNALQVPATITTQLPLEMIKAQLAAGNVRATVDQIMRGCDPAYQPAFARANLAHEVSLPLQEIFHNLPEDHPVDHGWQGEDSGIDDLDGSGLTGSEPAADSEDGGGEFLTASTGVPRNHDLDEERVFSALFEQAVGSDSAMGGEPEPLESLDAAEFSEQEAATSDGLSRGDLSGELARPEGIPPLVAAVVQSEAAPEEKQREELIDGDGLSREFAASDSRVARTAVRSQYEFGIEDRSGESALNSILMTDEELSIQRVAELASEFPGIGACCILSADGRLLGGNLPQNVEARVFEAMAPRLYRNFQELGTDLGLGNAEIFSVHTDRGTVSFFTSLHNCLVVLHSRRDFVPGVREKLISIAAELKHVHS